MFWRYAGLRLNWATYRLGGAGHLGLASWRWLALYPILNISAVCWLKLLIILLSMDLVTGVNLASDQIEVTLYYQCLIDRASTAHGIAVER